MLGLEHGIPSHDTFGELYAAIDTDQFSDCFSRWVADLASLTEGEVIAIDGKCLRRSVDKASKKPLFIWSARGHNKTIWFVVRAHWSIENNLHWVLDIAFDEDSNRTRKGHSAANLAVIRLIALNLIKAEKTAQMGVKIKRLKAGWDNDYLLRVIGVI